MVIQFPTLDDRAVVETAVSVFLITQDAHTRNTMLKTARAVLDRYGISSLGFGEFVVRKGKTGGVSIAGKREINGGRCPGCGADIYNWPGDVRIMNVREGFKYDIVNYGCRCGKVFYKREVAQ